MRVGKKTPKKEMENIKSGAKVMQYGLRRFYSTKNQGEGFLRDYMLRHIINSNLFLCTLQFPDKRHTIKRILPVTKYYNLFKFIRFIFRLWILWTK